MGKNGGPLSAWLKEFTALVFTQTIQAFIYAIIISIILFGMGSATDISPDDNNSALGLMATFALLSVFKVEEMAKKIFGIGDTKASHKNAMKSIAKTAIAAKLGKRVLNNTGKVFGGIRSINKASQDRAKQKKRLKEDMEDNGFVKDKDGKIVFAGKKKNASSDATGKEAKSEADKMSALQKKYYEMAKKAKEDGKTEDYEKYMGLAAAVRKDDKAAGNKVAANKSDGAISDAARRRMRNAVRNYEDKLDEINNARNEGIKQICSGFAESVGAMYGATAGGILGGADGNLDEMLQGILAGAGAGDAVGEMAVDGVDRAVKFVKRNTKHKERISSGELKRAINSYKKAVEDLETNYRIDVDDV